MFGWGSSKTTAPVYSDLPTPKSPEEFQALVKASVEKLLKLTDDTEGWTKMSFNKRGDLGEGVQCVSKPVEGAPVNASKAWGEVKGTPAELAAWLDVHEGEIDKDVIIWEKVKEVAPGIPLFYNAVSAPFPVTTREIVWLRHSEKFGENSYLLVGASFNSDLPIREGRVRATIAPAGWVIKPTATEGVSQVTRVICTDPRGSVPSFIVNMALGKTADAVIALRDKTKK